MRLILGIINMFYYKDPMVRQFICVCKKCICKMCECLKTYSALMAASVII